MEKDEKLKAAKKLIRRIEKLEKKVKEIGEGIEKNEQKYEEGKKALDKLKDLIDKKRRLLTDLSKKKEELNEIESDLKAFDEIKKILEKDKKLKFQNEFFTTLLIISAILSGILLVGIIVNPSLLLYILTLLFSISTLVSGIFKLQINKRKFEEIKPTLSKFGLSAENIEENIQKFEGLRHEKFKKLQEIKELNEKILNVEKYIEKLKLQNTLKDLFGIKSEKLEENISYWDEEIRKLEEILKFRREIAQIEQKAKEILQLEYLPEDLKLIKDKLQEFVKKNTPPKPIDLGKRPKKGTGRKTSKPQGNKQEDEKEPQTRVEPPYVQINLNETRVFLIIPKQRFKTNTVNDISQQLYYKLQLNGKEKSIPARIVAIENDIVTIDEIIEELDSPIKNFQIIYPAELGPRIYNYQHESDIFYAFIAIGNNLGRMYYLYDSQHNVNKLPKKDVWVLIKEGFDLSIEPDVIEETWIWEKYRPVLINLKNTNELAIKNNQTGEEKKIPCEISFSIQSDKLVEDDFKEQNLIVVGNSVKIEAPIKNKNGWEVWIQNKRNGYKLINGNWTGDESLELKLPENLPPECECGEFQIDIFEQKDKIPIETLFFRYIPDLKLEYPRELIIPNPNTGHKWEIIRILLGRDLSNWELNIVGNVQQYKPQKIKNGYQIELPPDQDTLRFSLVKKDKPETETNFQITVPRLRWKTSNMEHMTDKPLLIKRDELIPGSDLYLFVSTNDFETKCDFKAILEVNGQKLQEANLKRKAKMYTLRLNELYDTIKKNKGEPKLSLYIQGEMEILKVECIHFTKTIIVKKVRPFRLLNPKYEIAKKLEMVIDWEAKKQIKNIGLWIEKGVKLLKYKVFNEKTASCTLKIKTEIGAISIDVFLKRYQNLYLEPKYVKKVITPDEPPRLDTEFKKIKTFKLLNPTDKIAKRLIKEIDWETKNEVKNVEKSIEMGVKLMKYKVFSEKVAHCTLEIETEIGAISIDVFLKRYRFLHLEPKYVKVAG